MLFLYPPSLNAIFEPLPKIIVFCDEILPFKHSRSSGVSGKYIFDDLPPILIVVNFLRETLSRISILI